VRRWLVAVLAGGVVAAAAYRRRSLSLDGAIGAAVVGAVVFARAGLAGASALLVFFVSSSALSRLGEGRKQRSPLAQAKGARRDLWQVLANGGVATISIALGSESAFLGAIAAAAADTWATELGLLAPSEPRLITTLSTVVPGTSGAVTPLGFAASVGGALAVGMTCSLFGGGRRAIAVASIAGLCGSVADSLFGATIQAGYRCQVCGALAEEPTHRGCTERALLIAGERWITNDTVNALATLVGAIVGAILGPQRIGLRWRGSRRAVIGRSS
jgi:uncharacterized protein (TIGR00297 family)